jgi:glutathione S-transferase
VLSERLDGPFLMGAEMSVPDMLAVHCINWSIGAGFPRIDDKLGKWAKSLRDRPAFKAAQERGAEAA